jgi:hypothetical protein
LFKQSTSKPSVKVLERFMPLVVISKKALIKMQLYIEGCSDEIGWLGTVTKNNDNVFFIDDVFLFHQDVHSTTTEITPEGLSSFAEELLQQPDGIDIWNNIKLWGHSHVNMSTFSSTQDDKQMETFSEGGHPWFLRIIANKKGDLTIDLYDFQQGIIYSNLLWWEETTDLERAIEKQIAELKEQLANINSSIIETLKPAITDEIKKKVSHITNVIGFNNYKYNNIYNYNSYCGTINNDWFSYGDDGCIKDENDVFAIFSDDALMEIAQCPTYLSAKQLITILEGEFDNDEYMLIWKTAKSKFGLKVGY